MRARFEFLLNENGATEIAIVDADFIEQKNGWLIASKCGFVVFGVKENYVKCFWLYEE